MSPSVDAIGLHIVLSLATIMMVWFGVQEALASAQGGPGFNMGKFLNFFMLISFAYMFVKYYDSSIPGIGYSLKGFISQGTTSLAQTIGQDGIQSMFQSIDAALAKSGPGMAMFTAPYLLFAYISTQIGLSVLSAIAAVILAYGAVAGTIIGILGPIFIPFLARDLSAACAPGPGVLLLAPPVPLIFICKALIPSFFILMQISTAAIIAA